MVGTKKGEFKVDKSTSIKGSNQPPQAVPQRRYMVVDGLGVARAQAIMDERRAVEGAPDPHRHFSMRGGCFVG